jgi:hypothetical protein
MVVASARRRRLACASHMLEFRRRFSLSVPVAVRVTVSVWLSVFSVRATGQGSETGVVQRGQALHILMRQFWALEMGIRAFPKRER